jgi:hypothetical protein
MATKAELESELADLKRQLAERPVVVAEHEGDSAKEDSDTAAASKPVDWETEITDLIGQLDDITHKKPLLLALGALTVGYLLGRSK